MLMMRLRLFLVAGTALGCLPLIGCDILAVLGKNPVGCCYPLGNTGAARWSTQSKCSDSSEYWFAIASNGAEQDAMKACQKNPKPSARISSPDIDLGSFAVAASLLSRNSTRTNRPVSMRLITFSHPSDTLNSAPVSCLDTCSDVTDFKCTVISLPAETDKPLSQLITQVAKEPAFTITAQELMDRFGQPRDPCKRGSTAISSTSIDNVGEGACTITAPLGRNKSDISLNIPKSLKGEWTSRELPMQVTFKEGSLAPAVSFHDTTGQPDLKLNKDFGGNVLTAETDGKRFFLKTQRGCVGVSLEP